MMESIRTVVVGMGGRGIWAVETLAASRAFEIVAMVDELPQRAELIKQESQLNGVSVFSAIEPCLDQVDCDAVAVFTPDGRHAEVVLPALAAGRHVFVEKPLEITAQRLDDIIAADEAAGGKTFVGFNLRYAPVYAKIRELLDDGVAGQVLTVQADEFYDGGRTYFRRWNRFRSHGGGLWITKACHDFDLLYWMASAAPRSVFASASLDYYRPRPDAAMYCRDCDLFDDCPDRFEPDSTVRDRINEVTEQINGQRADLCLFNAEKDTFDHGSAIVTFTNNVVATYTVNVVAGFTNRQMRVAGSKAAIEGDLGASRVTVRHRDPSSEQVFELGNDEGGHGGGDQLILDAFADFVRGRPARFVAPAEAAVAVRIGLAATQSSDEHAAVELTGGFAS